MHARGSANGSPTARCWPTAPWARCSSRAASRSAPASTSWSLSRPELIGSIHREYLAAGADLIETATFGANRVRLAPFGLADQAGRLARRGAQIAREARDVAGRDVLVAGSVGPLGAPTNDLLHLDDATVRAAFREAIDGLLEGGVDLFMFETFSSLDHLSIAIEEARRAAADRPIVAPAHVRRGDRAARRHDAGSGGGRARRASTSTRSA